MSAQFRFFPRHFLFALTAITASAQTAPVAPPSAAATAPEVLDPYIVTEKLDDARELIVPSLGATSYIITQQQIETISQGANAPFSQILLRAPGVAADSAAAGGVHVRGEHANLQYRVNDVLLPEGLSGFGLELDPRFVGSLQLVTGSLPAQYGFRTAGIVDIHTRNGTFTQGGEGSVYGGSFGTLRPSFETGSSNDHLSYFVSGSYNHSANGIENPTANASAVHDTTDQSRLFTYFSYILDHTSRLSVMASASDSNFQVPNAPGLAAGTSPDGNPWLPGAFDSSRLNENQKEQNYYAIAAYQKSAGDLNYQVSVFGRESYVHFVTDPAGDLYFNGVASDVARQLRSVGIQGDFSYALGDNHTLRGGVTLLHESVAADSTTTVFPADVNGDPTGPSYAIADQDRLHGLFAGGYLQDEWKVGSKLTLNYGARSDVFHSSFDDENQLSPRFNFIYNPSESTTLHAGYARYFTPPPVENVSRSTVAQFDGTSNASAINLDDRVKAERSDYFDAGLSQKLAPGFTVGLDGYYKRARNQLDDGLFGQTLILSAFNYAKGEIYGLEFTASYTNGGFSAYANLAHSVAKGQEWNSAQFLFDPADLAYVKTHAIFLDHDQTWSGSAGISHRRKDTRGSTLVYADVIYGSGLRNDATAPDGSTIPNGAAVPSYVTFNLGAERSFKCGKNREWSIRFDVVNVADKIYELRDGSGVGVNAAQFGMRRGFFGSVSYKL